MMIEYINTFDDVFISDWCEVNENVKLVYNGNLTLNIKSPCLLKLTFRKNKLTNLEQID